MTREELDALTAEHAELAKERLEANRQIQEAVHLDEAQKERANYFLKMLGIKVKPPDDKGKQ